MAEEESMKWHHKLKIRRQGIRFWGLDTTMDEMIGLRDKGLLHQNRRKAKRMKYFLQVYPSFIEKVSKKENWTDEELRNEPYFEYIAKGHKHGGSACSPKLTRKVLGIMRFAIRLYKDIKEYGVKAPLDIYRDAPNSQRINLGRGNQRLEIMRQLGYKDVISRLICSPEIYRTHLSDSIPFGPIGKQGIHNAAIRQFIKLGKEATDKYWVHNYTPLYDFHLSPFYNKKIKILEFGVLQGASLLLWKEAFPNAQIFGVDRDRRIWRQWLNGQDRIKVLVGRQENTDFLKTQVIPEGPFDIVIDDCGHHPDAQLVTFNEIWPYLNSNGFYIIEDLHFNVDGRFAPTGPIMVDKLREMVSLAIGKNEIRGMSLYYNIAFIQKV